MKNSNDDDNPSAIRLVKQSGPSNRDLDINLDAHQEFFSTALRRVAAFLGTVQNMIDNVPPPQELNLHKGNMKLVYLPDKMPESEALTIQNLFSTWSIGNCLVELDQYFNRFLGNGLAIIRAAEDHRDGKFKPGSYKASERNTSDLFEYYYKICEYKNRNFLNIESQHRTLSLEKAFLESLKDARNSLVHDGGRVTLHRLRGRDKLTLKWPSMVMSVTTDGVTRNIPNSEPYIVTDEDVEKQSVLSASLVISERHYKLYEQINFTGSDLYDMIHFYETLSVEALSALCWKLKSIQPVFTFEIRPWHIFREPGYMF